MTPIELENEKEKDGINIKDGIDLKEVQKINEQIKGLDSKNILEIQNKFVGGLNAYQFNTLFDNLKNSIKENKFAEKITKVPRDLILNSFSKNNLEIFLKSYPSYNYDINYTSDKLEITPKKEFVVSSLKSLIILLMNYDNLNTNINRDPKKYQELFLQLKRPDSFKENEKLKQEKEILETKKTSLNTSLARINVAIACLEQGTDVQTIQPTAFYLPGNLEELKMDKRIKKEKLNTTIGLTNLSNIKDICFGSQTGDYFQIGNLSQNEFYLRKENNSFSIESKILNANGEFKIFKKTITDESSFKETAKFLEDVKEIMEKGSKNIKEKLENKTKELETSDAMINDIIKQSGNELKSLSIKPSQEIKENEILKLRQMAYDKIQELKKLSDKVTVFPADSVIRRSLDAAWLRIDSTPDKDFKKVLKQELEKASSDFGQNLRYQGLSELKTFTDNLLKDPILADESEKKDSSISWRTILDSSNEQTDSFKNYIEKPEFEQAYNDVFDIMYLALGDIKTIDLKTNVLLKKIYFKGETIEITQEHLNKFKKMIDSQLNGKTAENYTLSYKNSEDDKAKNIKSHYPQGIRLVDVKVKDATDNAIVAFGDTNRLQKDLAKAFEENIDKYNIKDLFTVVKQVKEIDGNGYVIKNSEGKEKSKFEGDDLNYKSYENQFRIDGHGGPEAMDVLIKNNTAGLENYFKSEGNMKDFLDNVIGTKPRPGYFAPFLKMISQKPELMNKYLGLLIDEKLQVKDNLKYLGNDLATKELMVKGLLEYSKTLDKKGHSEIIARITAVKANFDVQYAQEKKNGTGLKDQIAKYVGVLFDHPIGKFLLQFLDSFFGGKGGLLDKFGSIPGFKEAIDKQFKKQYGLGAEQMDLLKVLSKDGNIGYISDKKENFFGSDGKFLVSEYDKWFKKTSETSFTVEATDKTPSLTDKGKTLYSNFFDKDTNFKLDKDKKPLLDANLFYRVWTKNKANDPDNSLFNSVFTVDSNTKAISFKTKDSKDANGKDIKTPANPEQLKKLFAWVISDSDVIKPIKSADLKIKGQKKLFDKNVGDGISSELDYAKNMAAYLMKSDSGEQFHYVLSENDQTGDVAEVTPPTPTTTPNNSSNSHQQQQLPPTPLISEKGKTPVSGTPRIGNKPFTPIKPN